MNNEFKERMAERHKPIDEIEQKILSFYEEGRELTEEEKESFLAIEEKMIRNNILYLLYRVAKKYLTTGKTMEI